MKRPLRIEGSTEVGCPRAGLAVQALLLHKIEDQRLVIGVAVEAHATRGDVRAWHCRALIQHKRGSEPADGVGPACVVDDGHRGNRVFGEMAGCLWAVPRIKMLVGRSKRFLDQIHVGFPLQPGDELGLVLDRLALLVCLRQEVVEILLPSVAACLALYSASYFSHWATASW